MSGAEWLEPLCRHIPDRYEHLVRYVGWYSNRARGERAKKASLRFSVDGPINITSVMTQDTLADLGVENGDSVRVLVKAVNVLLVRE